MVSAGKIAGIILGVLLIVAGGVVGLLFGLKVIKLPAKRAPTNNAPPPVGEAPTESTPTPAASTTPAASSTPAAPAPVPVVPAPAPAPVAPVVPNPVQPSNTMQAANGTKFVLSQSRMCTMTTGPPEGGTLQELISNCATTTRLGGHTQCLGIQVYRDQNGVKNFAGCLSTAPASQYGGIGAGFENWILESEENLNYQ